MKSPHAVPGAMTAGERTTTAALASVFAMRMLGLFVVLPVLAVHGQELAGATPLLIGLAIGAYGLMQGVLQIPFGVLSDYLGRKPMIFLGLALFAAGGVVAAGSDSIEGVIAGRALQGCGAISGVVMALVADLTRESLRTRAMAVIGATIGLSFGCALVLGPLLVEAWGLSGLFLFTAAMALASMALVALAVPTPRRASPVPFRRLLPGLRRVLRRPALRRLDAGVFLLHLVMVALFIVLPPQLVADLGLPAAQHWQVYLPVVALSLLVMGPVLLACERRGRTQELLWSSGVLLVAALLLLAVVPGAWVLWLGLLLYFVAFNLLEALMPSLLTRLAPPGARGAALGVYSSGQFLGAFAGGIVGGALASVLPAGGVLGCCAALVAAWLLYLRTAGLADVAPRAGVAGDVRKEGAC